jgi:hypothetical protein
MKRTKLDWWRMVVFSDFRPDDQRRLDAMLEIFSRRTGDPITLESLVAQWIAFVDELQRGHRLALRDYEQHLSVRAMLEEIVEGLSERGREILIQALLHSDRRFLSLTVRLNSHPERTWWQRYPQNLHCS